MFDISELTSVSLDIAGSDESRARQEEIAQLVWYLLDSNYQIFLFSTNRNQDLSRENFQHPRVEFLHGAIPPTDESEKAHPELKSGRTLWVTDDPHLQKWLEAEKLKFAYRTARQSFGEQGIRIGSLADLAGLFDGSARVLGEVGAEILRRRGKDRAAPFLVGIGGPPMCGLPQFMVDLKGTLESLGWPVVDLMDMSALLRGTETREPADGDCAGWRGEAARHWFVREILEPLHAGSRVFVESLPAGVPREFEAHLPLFVSEESVLLMIGEMLFVPDITEVLDVSILLEVSVRETTRRLYEIPESEEFEDKFVTQYLAHEGGPYRAYMEAHEVAKNATVRVGAERPGSLTLNHIAGA